jgi:phage terminase large subunit-like protein
VTQSLEKRKLNDRLAFFEPNGPQEKFIQMVGTGGDVVYIFSAANGVGKTTLVVNILGNIIFGPQNKYFNYPIFKNWPYPKRLRYITDPELLKQIGPFHTEITKWWPRGRYTAEKAGKNYFSQYIFRDWVLDVMTYEQAVKDFEGVTLGAAVADEPPPEPIYHATMTRFRSGGFLMVPMTPLTSAGYVYDRIVPNHPNSIVYAGMEENCKEHGIRGQLEHDQIQKMKAEMPADQVEARFYGKALYLQGLIWKTFYPNVHVLKEDIRPPYGAPIWNVVDPHSDKPFASIWAFPDARGDIYIFDEWPNEDFYKMHNCQLTIQDYKKIFLDKEAGLLVYRRIIDRHFADTASAINKRTLRQELQAIGLNYQPSYKAEEEVDTGIEKVRRYLAYNTQQPLGPANQPKLFISPKCKNTIASMSKWSRNPDNGKVQESYKDFCDVVRYLLMDDPKIAEPLPAQEFKKRWG